MNAIHIRIKELRKEKDLTQEQLGNILGVVKSTISLYENGKSTPDDEIKVKIADYFDVTLDYLLGRTDDPNGEEEIVTIAAHHDGDEYTEEEKEAIENFKKLVISMRKGKKKD